MTRKAGDLVVPRKLRSPLVSVVIAAYNEARVIGEAIGTLLDQSYPHVEIVVVDDCSVDGTSRVVRRYARRGVRLLRLARNSGPGAGRNAGARIAKGEILVFVDADMVFDREYVSNLIRPIIAGKAIGTFHDTELIKNKDRVWARAFSINRIESPVEECGIFRAVLKDAFLSKGGFDESRGYFDDDLSAVGLSRRTHAVCYHNNPERLSEVFRHSCWVGRSLLRDPSLRQRVLPLVAVSWTLLLAIVFLVVIGSWAWMAALILLAAIPIVAVLLWKGIRRAINDGYLEFIVTVPIVWSVRLSGYWWGASSEMLRRNGYKVWSFSYRR